MNEADKVFVTWGQQPMASERRILAQLQKRLGDSYLNEGACTRGHGNWMSFPSAGTAAWTYRFACDAMANCSMLRFWFNGWRCNQWTVPSAGYTIKMAFQAADANGNPTGSPIPVYFNGARTATVNQQTIVVSDPLPVFLAAGQRFFVLTYTATNPNVLGNRILSPVAGEGINSGGDFVDSGTITTTNRDVMGMAPAMITGRLVDGDRKGVLLVGDSISFSGDDWGTGDALGGVVHSWAARAVAPYAPYVNIACNGTSAAQWAVSATSYPSLFPALFCRDAIVNLGVNDGGGSSAQCLTNLTAIVAMLRTMGLRKVLVCTINPNNTSTDGWTTAGNQTAWNVESTFRNPVNAALRATGGGVVGADGLIDSSGRIENPANSALWDAVSSIAYSDTTAASGNSISQITINTLANATQAWEGKVLSINISGTQNYAPIETVRPDTGVILPAGNFTAAAGNAVAFNIINTLTRDGLHPTTAGSLRMAAAFDPSTLDLV
jgi:hypothetical protein